MISRAALEEMFDSIAARGTWDMTNDMLWGYFFTHSSRPPLEEAAGALRRNGYRFVDIHLGDKEAEDIPDTWWLHVEKVETHTVETLHARNLELYDFAERHHLDSYDGMDVGPVK